MEAVSALVSFIVACFSCVFVWFRCFFDMFATLHGESEFERPLNLGGWVSGGKRFQASA